MRRIRQLSDQERALYNKDVLGTGELEHFRHLLTNVYPKGIVSIVSDTWDYWRVLTEFLPRLKDVIMNREGTCTIRPDSGDPIKIICGDTNSSVIAEQKGTVELLWDVFGGTINSKGYKQLDSHISCIYGDSITIDRAKLILEGLKQKGFASTNIILGIGSYTYQYVTRDTFGLAFKCTACKINGEWKQVFKDPVTDSGMKRSAKGLLAVIPDVYTGEYTLHENVSEEVERSSWNCLRTVFSDGKLVSETTLTQVRERLHKGI